MASFLFILKVPVEDNISEDGNSKVDESNENKSDVDNTDEEEGSESKDDQSSSEGDNHKDENSTKKNKTDETSEQRKDDKDSDTETENDTADVDETVQWDFDVDVNKEKKENENTERVPSADESGLDRKDKESTPSKKFNVTKVPTEEVPNEQQSVPDQQKSIPLNEIPQPPNENKVPPEDPQSESETVSDKQDGQKSKKKFDVKKVESEETSSSAPDVLAVAEDKISVNKSTESLPDMSVSNKTESLSAELSESPEHEDKDQPDKDDTLKQVKFQTQVSATDEKDLQHFIEKTTALQDVEHILNYFDIENYTVIKTKSGLFYQVMFVDEGGQRCEAILNALTDAGISVRDGTSLGIYPSSIFKGKVEEDDDDSTDMNYYEGEFRKSIKARLLVSQVVNMVQSNAEFKFDFLMLVITASIIAGLGLVESSSVILVASMLVSPLMGPILAGTFGFVIKNYSLRNLGIASEIKGLLICVLCGFIVGLIASVIAVHYGTLGGTESYPTDEMKARGVLRGLIPGLLIAVASGVGVALSVLGGNAGSLVGVAISASLLPPAVNAGMLWAHSLLTVIKPLAMETIDVVHSVNSTNQTISVPVIPDDNPLNCTAFLHNKYIPVYSCQMPVESVFLGLISISLTILNIICIFIMGIIFLKIKEVAPQTSTSDATRDFWKDDLKIARESYETMKGKKSLSFAADVKKLFQDMQKHKKGGKAEESYDYEKGYAQLREIIEDVENDSSVQGIQKYIPGSNRSRPFSQQLGSEFPPGSPIFPGAPIHSHYLTYHGPHRELSGFNRPKRTGSGRTINSPKTGDVSELETIDERTPLSPEASESNSRGPRLKFPNSKLFRRRANSFDVQKEDKSHPV